MEEMEEEPPTPPTPASPFWIPSRSTRPRHRPSALFLNTGLHVAFLSIIAIVLMVLVAPSLLSHTQQVFKPSSVKRGWDSLNLVLVAFAIVCGFVGRKGGSGNEDIGGSKAETPQYEKQYNGSFGDQSNVVQLSPLRRACSSYPDLIRQEMMWDDEYNPRSRSYDDSYSVNYYKSPRLVRSIESCRSQKSSVDEEKDDYDVKVIEVDSVRIDAPKESPPPPPQAQAMPPTQPPPPPPPEAASGKEYESVKRRVRRDGQGRRKLVKREDHSPPPLRARSPPPPPTEPEPTTSIGARRRASRQENESNDFRVKRESQGRSKLDPREAQSPQTPTPPPPPPPPAPESSSRSSQKKRSGVTNNIISSIYHQSKKKKNQRRKSHENLDNLIITPPNPNFPPPSPPPPPPPPPPSFFHTMFSSKKGKTSTKPTSIPPPPPPPPRRRRPLPPPSPPPQPKRTDFDRIVGDGSESPMIRIPPPPPPPPFKVPSWKFVIEGDYVKITGSPRSEDDSTASTPTAASPLFCPSPDVNMKADDFIARFRAKLKLEKMNSIKNKQGMETGLSPLGPDSGPI